mgnify:FL=1
MKLFNFSHPLSEDAKRRLVEVVQIDYEDFNEEIFKFQLDMSDNVVGQVLNSVIENIISKVANEKYLYDKNAREEDAFLIVLPSLSIAAGIFAAMLQNAVDSRVIPDCGLVVIKPQTGIIGTQYVPEDIFWLDEI